MSLSDSSGEDEQMIILEAQRATHSPPRKRRRLNDHRSQSQHTSSDDDSSSNSSSEELKSDKENSLNRLNRNRKRIAPTSSTQMPSHRSRNNRRFSSQPNANSGHEIYTFGKHKFNFPLNVKPGALVRLELVNFLCHSNFSISFNPMVNIIYGQNGSGKSAIEAGISMALGLNAKKTGRGNNIAEVIKFGEDTAMIRLFLNNQGVEALPEYGAEICIERRLTRAKGGSSFRILDADTMKILSRQRSAVKAIATKLNLCVENPCVVLKQTTAKQLLNSTKNTDKFKFFMDASKLGAFEEAMREAKQQLDEAIYEQRSSKDSFHVIAQRYNECKQQYDMLVNKQVEEQKVVFWQKAEMWMRYHAERKTLPPIQKEVEEFEFKIQSANETHTKKNKELAERVSMANALKQEIEEKMASKDQYQEPINVLKGEMAKLDKQRGAAARKASSNQRYVDQAQRRIRGFQKQYQEAVQASQNNETTQQLARLQANLTQAIETLTKLRTEREPLAQKIEPTIEMKENEAQLNALQSRKTYAQDEHNRIQRDLRNTRQNRDRSNLFLAQNARNARVTMQAIRQEIQRYHRQFERMPIGPLGEYIQMVPQNDTNIENRNIQIVQNVLSSSLCTFLVSSTRDMGLFRRIMRQRFGMVPPVIQYRFSDQPHNICVNPFQNYRFRDGENSHIVRVTDMFTIKDQNAWVYNALLTNSQPERVYAYGKLDEARALLSRLSADQMRRVTHLLTYDEDGLFTVKRRGDSVSSNNNRLSSPILQRDQSRVRQFHQNKLNEKIQEIRGIENEMAQLRAFVMEAQQTLKEYQRQFTKVNRNITTYERKIEQWQREKTQLEEEEEDDNELQESMRDLQNSIDDERAQIQSLMEQIQPYKDKESELIQEISTKKRELQRIETQLRETKHAADTMNDRFVTLLSEMKKDKSKLDRIPAKIEEFKRNLKSAQNTLENERKRIETLRDNAEELGEEVTRDEYPRRRNGRAMSITQLKQERLKLAAEIEEWKNQENNDPEEITQRFESIKPKYENHQRKVENCNRNCNEMKKQLRARKKQYDAMKDQVKGQLSKEFRFIMRKQGHDGVLKVNYETGELDMQVHMASHDGSTQVVNSKTLSGGERSFTQVALIMALQKFSGSPMCIYDEFDVFMDSVNRGNSIRILLAAALGDDVGNKSNKNRKAGSTTDRQYIFITPNDVSPIIAQGHRHEISIHKLKPPRNDK